MNPDEVRATAFAIGHIEIYPRGFLRHGFLIPSELSKDFGQDWQTT
jgi:hypothetical protein